MKKPLLLALAAFAAACPAARADSGPFLLHADALAAARASLGRGDPGLEPALRRLEADADEALRLAPLAVTQKTRLAPSGDPHDYLSQAPYWWPDPAKPGGLPYIRRDGETNPESGRGLDAASWGRTAGAISTLGLAYSFTGREEYARRAALLARVWFLDPATRMNPNVRFGQFVPGVTPGRGEGVLAFRALPEVCDALGLIAGSSAWGPADREAFRRWLASYYDWVTTSAVGIEERDARNNHGSWYDVQVAALALELGRESDARRILAEGLTRRVAFQVEPDGRLPLELARTKSLSYSLFDLRALTELAVLAERLGIDYWAPPASGDGARTLRRAFGYHAPFADPALPWPKHDLQPGNRAELLPLLAEALRHGEDPRFRSLLERFGAAGPERDARWRLLLDQPAPLSPPGA